MPVSPKLKFISIKTDEGTQVHAPAAFGDYDSLCGMDANDSEVGHLGIEPTPAKARITCFNCAETIRVARTYKLKDLAP